MIRAVEKNDIPECVDVIKRSFMTVAEEFGITPENGGRFTAFATTEQRLLWQMGEEKRPMYAYDDNGRITGYYSLSLSRSEDGGGKECELGDLCVLPEYRHAGIGEKLMLDALARAKDMGCDKMKLSIVEENTVLKRWYEGFGFKETHTVKYDFFPFTCGYMEREIG